MIYQVKKQKSFQGQITRKFWKNGTRIIQDKEPIEIKYAASSTGLTTRVQHIENGTI